MSSSKALTGSVFVNAVFSDEEYDPKYCTLDEFKSYIQTDISEETIPSTDEAIRLLQGAEAEVDSKEWGKYIQVDEYLDGQYELMTFNWAYSGFFAQIIYPQHPNIIRMITCHYNAGGPASSDPIWQEVKEGPASNSQFVVMRKSRLKSQVGSSLMFYSNVPYPGPLRFRLTYEYGMNVDRSLLREFVGKKAAMDALEMRASGENINLNMDKGPWAALYRAYGKRLTAMKEELFPKMTRKVWVFPSTM